MEAPRDTRRVYGAQCNQTVPVGLMSPPYGWGGHRAPLRPTLGEQRQRRRWRGTRL